MTFASALIIAVAYWHGQGYTVPCHPVPVPKAETEMPLVGNPAFDLEPYADMATTGCDIWLSPAARANSSDPDMEASFCAEVTHEVGHVIGLAHTTGGIMSGTGIYSADYPPRCVRHYPPLKRVHLKRWNQ